MRDPDSRSTFVSFALALLIAASALTPMAAFAQDRADQDTTADDVIPAAKAEVPREAGGDIILTGASPTILHVLDVLDLSDYLTIMTKHEKALAACGVTD